VRAWFGLFGAPAAWTVQHVTGYALSEAACDRGGLDLDAWTIAVTAAAAAVAVLAGVAALATYRATPSGDEPPASRVRFLAILGMTVAPLFLAIILMSGIGVTVLVDCHQG
jgi:Mn2+/Fe2+ NRAMP family transporter